MGIEPTTSAWKAEVLPLNYTRIFLCRNLYVPDNKVYYKCILSILQELYS